MALLQGKDFMVEIDGAIVGAGTDCSLDTDVKTKESTPYKQSEGEFDEYTPESYGWSVSTENLVMTVEDHKKLLKLQKAHVTDPSKKTVPVSLVEVEKGDDGVIKAKAEGMKCSGKAIITKLSQKYTNKEDVKLSTTLQGTGDLTIE